MKPAKFSVIGMILSVIFGAIVYTLVFGVLSFINYPFFEIKLIFISVNVLAIMILAMFGGLIAQGITVPMFVAISFATAVYTIFQFGTYILFGTVFAGAGVSIYVLTQLIIHLVYFAVILPLGKVGYASAQMAKKDI